ncbi:hypothetical protein Tco_1413466 [Tanacetum coccineum]
MIGDLWVEVVISMKGILWVGDGGISGVSLSMVSSSDDKNGEMAGNGGTWSDDGSSNGSGSESDAGSHTGYSPDLVYSTWFSITLALDTKLSHPQMGPGQNTCLEA